MPVKVIESDASLDTLLEEAIYPLVRLGAHPLTAPLAGEYEVFILDWFGVMTEEVNLRIAKLKASAVADLTDDDLDELTKRFAKILTTIVTATSELYKFYFPRPPSDVIRPRLGDQLAMAKAWIQSLLDSPHKALNDIGAEISIKAAAGTAAEDGLSKTDQAMKEFRTLGKRRALFDRFNALQKSTYGKVSEMPHAMPLEHLPHNFAEPFFKHEKSKPAKKATSKELGEEIEKAEKALVALKAQFTQAQKDEAAAAAKVEKARVKQLELADAETAEEAAKARVAEIKAELEKGK